MYDIMYVMQSFDVFFDLAWTNGRANSRDAGDLCAIILIIMSLQMYFEEWYPSHNGQWLYLPIPHSIFTTHPVPQCWIKTT